MVKVYARQCEKGEKNFYDDIVNSKSASVRKLADQIRDQIHADGYVILDDGTVVMADLTSEYEDEEVE